jgi:flagellin-like hook-associated protein FlgL
MSTILSAQARASLRALQEISTLMALSQSRLATGLRVQSPIDDPSAFFTASSLNTRAAQLNDLVDAGSNAIKTLEAANSGLDAITALVESAQSVANDARLSTATNAKVTGTVAALTGAFSMTEFELLDTITVSDGTVTATYTADASPTLQEFLDAVNNEAGLKIEASLDASGRVVLEALSTNNIIIGGSSNSTEKAQIGLVAGTTTGTLNSTRQALAVQFDQLRTQIDQAVADASYNGVNLLNGDNLTVVFNETGSSKLTVTGVTYSSTVLGIPVASTGSAFSFQSDIEIDAALATITTALTTLSGQSTVFASNMSIVQTRQDFNTAMADLLSAGAEELVLADTNAEGATLLALKTRQELSTTALSFATSADRSTLILFGLA